MTDQRLLTTRQKSAVGHEDTLLFQVRQTLNPVEWKAKKAKSSRPQPLGLISAALKCGLKLLLVREKHVAYDEKQ